MTVSNFHHPTWVRTLLLVGVATVLLATACDRGDDGSNVGVADPPFIASGDLEQIRKSGRLRVLYPRVTVGTHLPRKGNTLDYELDLARSYAETLGLEPVFIYVESRERLIPDLLAGRGDLIAGNLTVTPERRDQVAFTVPLEVVREQVVIRAGDTDLDGPGDLVGRRVAVRRSSSYWETVNSLRSEHDGIEIQEVPEELDTEEILHRVALGSYDLAVADSNLVDATLSYRDDLRSALDLTDDRAVAWAVRPGSRELLAGLNRFLTDSRLTTRETALDRSDLPGIHERRVIRVLTRNSPASYFLWKGRLMGFEYDLAKRFSKRHRLRLEMIVPPAGEDLLEWLREGKGDVIAASMTPAKTDRVQGLEFSRPYNWVSQLVVTRSDDVTLSAPVDLAGRTFHVRRSSAYWESLEQRIADGATFKLAEAPAQMSTEEIIAKVADGSFDLTLADSHILDIELTWRDNVRGAFPLGEPVALAWVVRKENPELLATVNDFLRREYRGLFYNMKYDQYFRNAARIRSHIEQGHAASGGLSPYDDVVRRFADEAGFDWRLIVSQMFQESRFDPQARSFAGAVGLMQVLPRTAEELGYTDDLHDPETGISAGVAYLSWVRDRFDEELPVTDRMWFTLAAYNAGPGHVRDARRLAEKLGLNPNRWDDNVEAAMRLLSSPKYYSGAPHGYCRCGQAVHYVREIRQRYLAYVEGTARLTAAAADRS